MNLEDLIRIGQGMTSEGSEITGLTNPITRFPVRFEPPYPMNDGRTEQLYDAFARYCQAAWENEASTEQFPLRINPAVVDPWALLDGKMPLPNLDRELADLVQAFGYGAVEYRLGLIDPVKEGA